MGIRKDIIAGYRKAVRRAELFDLSRRKGQELKEGEERESLCQLIKEAEELRKGLQGLERVGYAAYQIGHPARDYNNSCYRNVVLI